MLLYSNTRDAHLFVPMHFIHIYIYIYIIYTYIYLYVPDEGSLLPKYRDCTTSNDFESYIHMYICIYVYIYNKFTEASHHNTLNIAQSSWM